jgi:hypothetical protein
MNIHLLQNNLSTMSDFNTADFLTQTRWMTTLAGKNFIRMFYNAILNIDACKNCET